MCGLTHIEAFTRRAGLGKNTVDKWLQVISNKMLFKTVIPLKN